MAKVERRRWVALRVTPVQDEEDFRRQGLRKAAMGGQGLLHALVRLILQPATAHANMMAEAHRQGKSEAFRYTARLGHEAGCKLHRLRMPCTPYCLIVLPSTRLCV